LIIIIGDDYSELKHRKKKWHRRGRKDDVATHCTCEEWVPLPKMFQIGFQTRIQEWNA